MTFRAETAPFSGSAPPSGPAGGDLAGTYPNPRLAGVILGTGGFTSFTNPIAVGSTVSPGAGNIGIGNGHAYMLRNSADTNYLAGIQINAGDQMTVGDVNATNMVYQAKAAGSHQFLVGATEVERVGPNGVGIGTTADPGAGNLGFGNAKGILFRNAANAAFYAGLSLSAGDVLIVGGVDVGGVTYNTKTGTPHSFQINGSTKVTLTANGGVAVGLTTDPGANIVAVANTGAFQFRNAAASAYLNGMTVSGADAMTIGDANIAGITHNIKTANIYTFQVNSVEKVRITSSGGIVFGALTADPGNGVGLNNNGAAIYGRNNVDTAWRTLLYQGNASCELGDVGQVTNLNGSTLVTSTVAFRAAADFQAAGGDSTGAPGAATINKPSGRSAIAAGAATCTITNNLVTASSAVFATLQTNDATATFIDRVVPGAGSFTITVNGLATGNVNFCWFVVNP